MPTHDDTGRAAGASEGTVVVTETSAGGYTRQISAGHHQLAADEPPPVGDDTGPTPYDLVTCRARCLHVHDGADVRRPQALAAGRDPSNAAALANSRKRLCRLRNHQWLHPPN
jgi:hypothetical protein